MKKPSMILHLATARCLARVGLVILMTATAGQPLMAQVEERIAFVSEKEEPADALQRRYLDTLEDELRSLVASHTGVEVVGSPNPGLPFFSDQGVDHLISAELSAHSAGVRMKLRLRKTAGGGTDLLEHSIFLEGVNMQQDVLKMRQEWALWFWPTVELRTLRSGQVLLLADCIQPFDEATADLSTFLTIQYPRQLRSSLPSERFSIRGVTRQELELVCRRAGSFPLENAYNFVVSGFLLENGTRVELYFRQRGGPPHDPLEITIPAADRNEAARMIATKVAEITPAQ